MNPLVDKLREMEACPDAIEWVAGQECSAYDMWRRCERGDWLLWLAARVDVDRRLVVMAACACAREALVYVPTGEERPLIAIEMAEAWCRGDATIRRVQKAARGAYRYADAASDDAAYAASDAAYAAAATAAATAATYNADFYSAADYAADADADRAKSLATSARHVRRIIPWATVRDAMEAMG